MVDSKSYKRSIIFLSIIIAVLCLMIAVGFTIGLLSEDPDGLERVLIDAQGEDFIDELPSPWDPYLGWIENEYVAGIIGTLLSATLIICPFYLIALLKRRKKDGCVIVKVNNAINKPI